MLSQILTFLLRLFLILAILMPAMANAVEISPDQSPNELLLTPLTESAPASSILDPNDPALDNEAIEFRYDPKEFADEVDRSGTKQELLSALRSEMESPHDTTKVFIPRAPLQQDHFSNIEKLQENEIQSFLGKKQKFLEKIAKGLVALRLQPKFVNKVLSGVNEKFYKNALLIAKSNSNGVTVAVSAGAGLGLPKKIAEKLRQRAFGKFIPKSGGFVYLTALGIGISRHLQEDGRHHWVFDVFLDVERLKSSVTGVVRASALATFGIVYELREGDFKQLKSTITYGRAGVMRQSTYQLGMNVSSGFSFPPFMGPLIVFQADATRHYIARLDFTNLSSKYVDSIAGVVASWAEKTGSKKSNAVLSCSKVLL